MSYTTLYRNLITYIILSLVNEPAILTGNLPPHPFSSSELIAREVACVVSTIDVRREVRRSFPSPSSTDVSLRILALPNGRVAALIKPLVRAFKCDRLMLDFNTLNVKKLAYMSLATYIFNMIGESKKTLSIGGTNVASSSRQAEAIIAPAIIVEDGEQRYILDQQVQLPVTNDPSEICISDKISMFEHAGDFKQLTKAEVGEMLRANKALLDAKETLGEGGIDIFDESEQSLNTRVTEATIKLDPDTLENIDSDIYNIKSNAANLSYKESRCLMATLMDSMELTDLDTDNLDNKTIFVNTDNASHIRNKGFMSYDNMFYTANVNEVDKALSRISKTLCNMLTKDISLLRNRLNEMGVHGAVGCIAHCIESLLVSYKNVNKSLFDGKKVKTESARKVGYNDSRQKLMPDNEDGSFNKFENYGNGSILIAITFKKTKAKRTTMAVGVPLYKTSICTHSSIGCDFSTDNDCCTFKFIEIESSMNLGYINLFKYDKVPMHLIRVSVENWKLAEFAEDCINEGINQLLIALKLIVTWAIPSNVKIKREFLSAQLVKYPGLALNALTNGSIFKMHAGGTGRIEIQGPGLDEIMSSREVLFKVNKMFVLKGLEPCETKDGLRLKIASVVQDEIDILGPDNFIRIIDELQEITVGPLAQYISMRARCSPEEIMFRALSTGKKMLSLSEWTSMLITVSRMSQEETEMVVNTRRARTEHPRTAIKLVANEANCAGVQLCETSDRPKMSSKRFSEYVTLSRYMPGLKIGMMADPFYEDNYSCFGLSDRFGFFISRARSDWQRMLLHDMTFTRWLNRLTREEISNDPIFKVQEYYMVSSESRPSKDDILSRCSKMWEDSLDNNDDLIPSVMERSLNLTFQNQHDTEINAKIDLNYASKVFDLLLDIIREKILSFTRVCLVACVKAYTNMMLNRVIDLTEFLKAIIIKVDNGLIWPVSFRMSYAFANITINCCQLSEDRIAMSVTVRPSIFTMGIVAAGIYSAEYIPPAPYGLEALCCESLFMIMSSLEPSSRTEIAGNMLQTQDGMTLFLQFIAPICLLGHSEAMMRFLSIPKGEIGEKLLEDTLGPDSIILDIYKTHNKKPWEIAEFLRLKSQENIVSNEVLELFVHNDPVYTFNASDKLAKLIKVSLPNDYMFITKPFMPLISMCAEADRTRLRSEVIKVLSDKENYSVKPKVVLANDIAIESSLIEVMSGKMVRLASCRTLEYSRADMASPTLMMHWVASRYGFGSNEMAYYLSQAKSYFFSLPHTKYKQFLTISSVKDRVFEAESITGVEVELSSTAWLSLSAGIQELRLDGCDLIVVDKRGKVKSEVKNFMPEHNIIQNDYINKKSQDLVKGNKSDTETNDKTGNMESVEAPKTNLTPEIEPAPPKPDDVGDDSIFPEVPIEISYESTMERGVEKVTKEQDVSEKIGNQDKFHLVEKIKNTTDWLVRKAADLYQTVSTKLKSLLSRYKQAFVSFKWKESSPLIICVVTMAPLIFCYLVYVLINSLRRSNNNNSNKRVKKFFPRVVKTSTEDKEKNVAYAKAAKPTAELDIESHLLGHNYITGTKGYNCSGPTAFTEADLPYKVIANVIYQLKLNVTRDADQRIEVCVSVSKIMSRKFLQSLVGKDLSSEEYCLLVDKIAFETGTQFYHTSDEIAAVKLWDKSREAALMISNPSHIDEPVNPSRYKRLEEIKYHQLIKLLCIVSMIGIPAIVVIKMVLSAINRVASSSRNQPQQYKFESRSTFILKRETPDEPNKNKFEEKTTFSLFGRKLPYTLIKDKSKNKRSIMSQFLLKVKRTSFAMSKKVSLVTPKHSDMLNWFRKKRTSSEVSAVPEEVIKKPTKCSAELSLNEIIFNVVNEVKDTVVSIVKLISLGMKKSLESALKLIVTVKTKLNHYVNSLNKSRDNFNSSNIPKENSPRWADTFGDIYAGNVKNKPAGSNHGINHSSDKHYDDSNYYSHDRHYGSRNQWRRYKNTENASKHRTAKEKEVNKQKGRKSEPKGLFYTIRSVFRTLMLSTTVIASVLLISLVVSTEVFVERLVRTGASLTERTLKPIIKAIARDRVSDVILDTVLAAGSAYIDDKAAYTVQGLLIIKNAIAQAATAVVHMFRDYTICWIIVHFFSIMFSSPRVQSAALDAERGDNTLSYEGSGKVESNVSYCGLVTNESQTVIDMGARKNTKVSKREEKSSSNVQHCSASMHRSPENILVSLTKTVSDRLLGLCGKISKAVANKTQLVPKTNHLGKTSSTSKGKVRTAATVGIDKVNEITLKIYDSLRNLSDHGNSNKTDLIPDIGLQGKSFKNSNKQTNLSGSNISLLIKIAAVLAVSLGLTLTAASIAVMTLSDRFKNRAYAWFMSKLNMLSPPKIFGYLVSITEFLAVRKALNHRRNLFATSIGNISLANAKINEDKFNNVTDINLILSKMLLHDVGDFPKDKSAKFLKGKRVVRLIHGAKNSSALLLDGDDNKFVTVAHAVNRTVTTAESERVDSIMFINMSEFDIKALITREPPLVNDNVALLTSSGNTINLKVVGVSSGLFLIIGIQDYKGMSGAPVINYDGKLVGVFAAQIEDSGCDPVGIVLLPGGKLKNDVKVRTTIIDSPQLSILEGTNIPRTRKVLVKMIEETFTGTAALPEEVMTPESIRKRVLCKNHSMQDKSKLVLVNGTYELEECFFCFKNASSQKKIVTAKEAVKEDKNNSSLVEMLRRSALHEAIITPTSWMFVSFTASAAIALIVGFICLSIPVKMRPVISTMGTLIFARCMSRVVSVSRQSMLWKLSNLLTSCFEAVSDEDSSKSMLRDEGNGKLRRQILVQEMFTDEFFLDSSHTGTVDNNYAIMFQFNQTVNGVVMILLATILKLGLSRSEKRISQRLAFMMFQALFLPRLTDYKNHILGIMYEVIVMVELASEGRGKESAHEFMRLFKEQIDAIPEKETKCVFVANQLIDAGMPTEFLKFSAIEDNPYNACNQKNFNVDDSKELNSDAITEEAKKVSDNVDINCDSAKNSSLGRSIDAVIEEAQSEDDCRKTQVETEEKEQKEPKINRTSLLLGLRLGAYMSCSILFHMAEMSTQWAPINYATSKLYYAYTSKIKKGVVDTEITLPLTLTALASSLVIYVTTRIYTAKMRAQEIFVRTYGRDYTDAIRDTKTKPIFLPILSAAMSFAIARKALLFMRADSIIAPLVIATARLAISFKTEEPIEITSALTLMMATPGVMSKIFGMLLIMIWITFGIKTTRAIIPSIAIASIDPTSSLSKAKAIVKKADKRFKNRRKNFKTKGPAFGINGEIKRMGSKTTITKTGSPLYWNFNEAEDIESKFKIANTSGTNMLESLYHQYKMNELMKPATFRHLVGAARKMAVVIRAKLHDNLNEDGVSFLSREDVLITYDYLMKTYNYSATLGFTDTIDKKSSRGNQLASLMWAIAMNLHAIPHTMETKRQKSQCWELYPKVEVIPHAKKTRLLIAQDVLTKLSDYFFVLRLNKAIYSLDSGAVYVGADITRNLPTLVALYRNLFNYSFYLDYSTFDGTQGTQALALQTIVMREALPINAPICASLNIQNRFNRMTTKEVMTYGNNLVIGSCQASGDVQTTSGNSIRNLLFLTRMFGFSVESLTELTNKPDNTAAAVQGDDAIGGVQKPPDRDQVMRRAAEMKLIIKPENFVVIDNRDDTLRATNPSFLSHDFREVKVILLSGSVFKTVLPSRDSDRLYAKYMMRGAPDDEGVKKKTEIDLAKSLSYIFNYFSLFESLPVFLIPLIREPIMGRHVKALTKDMLYILMQYGETEIRVSMETILEYHMGPGSNHIKEILFDTQNSRSLKMINFSLGMIRHNKQYFFKSEMFDKLENAYQDMILSGRFKVKTWTEIINTISSGTLHVDDHVGSIKPDLDFQWEDKITMSHKGDIILMCFRGADSGMLEPGRATKLFQQLSLKYKKVLICCCQVNQLWLNEKGEKVNHDNCECEIAKLIR